MKTRHVLAIDPQGHLSSQPLQITAEHQALHCVESVAAAKKILARNHCSVGLVVIDSFSPEFQDEIEKLIAAVLVVEAEKQIYAGVRESSLSLRPARAWAGSPALSASRRETTRPNYPSP